MTEWLEVLDEAGGAVETIALEPDVIKIGRLESCHVRLDGDDVSRLHAVMERTDERMQIIDLGSTTGTLVNGSKISKKALEVGDIIQIGGHRLRYAGRVRSQPRPAPPAVEPATNRRCPRCRGALAQAQATEEGGYRDGAVTAHFLRCNACAISIVQAEVLRARYHRTEARLGGTAMERDRRPSDKNCPFCTGELEHLTLAWDDVWVEVEECPRCGGVVMDDGEGARLDALLR